MRNYWLKQRKNQKTVPYLDNVTFTDTILKFQATDPNCELQTRIDIDECFHMLITNIFKFFGQGRYTNQDAEECKRVCYRYVSKFNPKKGAAFNYFTTIILNTLRRIYRKKRQK